MSAWYSSFREGGTLNWRTRPCSAPTVTQLPRALKRTQLTGSASCSCTCFQSTTRAGLAHCSRTLPFHEHDTKCRESTGWNATAMTLSSCLHAVGAGVAVALQACT